MLIFARQTRVASAVVFSLALVYTLSFPCLSLFSTITLSIFYLPLHLSPLPPLPPPPSTVSSRRGPRSTNPSPLLVKSFTLSPSKPRLQQRRRKKGKSRSFPTETLSSLGYSEKTSVSWRKYFYIHIIVPPPWLLVLFPAAPPIWFRGPYVILRKMLSCVWCERLCLQIKHYSALPYYRNIYIYIYIYIHKICYIPRFAVYICIGSLCVVFL